MTRAHVAAARAALRARVTSTVCGRRDGGVVAILTGLLMTIFIGFCAISVDVGHWFLVREQTQKAADAAAMAAVVNLPDNLDKARTTADLYAAKNGYPVGTTTRAVPGDPDALVVTVTTTVDNFFAGLFGLPTSTISSTAKAVYTPPLQMGVAGCNTLGYDPEQPLGVPGCPVQAGRTWLSVGSQTALPNAGDPFQSRGGRGANADFRPAGYAYDIKVAARTPQLTVSIFDPTWVFTDADCNNTAFVNFWSAIWGARLDAAHRAAGLQSPFCTADDIDPNANIINLIVDVMDTNFELKGPDGRTLCTHLSRGFNGRNVLTLLHGPDLKTGYRQWQDLCTLTNADPGTYTLSVTAAPPDFLAFRGMPASNHFSIRATDGGTNSGLSVSGHEALSVYANTDTGSPATDTTTWPLAQVPSSAAGRTIKARFYDLGDCVGACRLTMSILRPDGNVATGCRNRGVTTVSSCAYPVPAADFDGKWQEIDIPIPAGYSCTPTSPGDCTYRVQVSGGQPQDVSTWTATFSGPPIRLER